VNIFFFHNINTTEIFFYTFLVIVFLFRKWRAGEEEEEGVLETARLLFIFRYQFNAQLAFNTERIMFGG